jgi:hypothetical protein
MMHPTLLITLLAAFGFSAANPLPSTLSNRQWKGTNLTLVGEGEDAYFLLTDENLRPGYDDPKALVAAGLRGGTPRWRLQATSI